MSGPLNIVDLPRLGTQQPVLTRDAFVRDLNQKMQFVAQRAPEENAELVKGAQNKNIPLSMARNHEQEVLPDSGQPGSEQFQTTDVIQNLFDSNPITFNALNEDEGLRSMTWNEVNQLGKIEEDVKNLGNLYGAFHEGGMFDNRIDAISKGIFQLMYVSRLSAKRQAALQMGTDIPQKEIDLMDEYVQTMYEAFENDNVGLVGSFFDAAAEQIPIFGLIGASAVTGGLAAGPAGAAAGAVAAGTYLESTLAFAEYSTMRDADGERVDPRLASNAAILAGSLAGSLEAFGFGAVARVLGRRLLPRTVARRIMRDAMTNPTTKGLMAQLAKEYQQGVVRETTTEALQGGITHIGGNIVKALDLDAFEEARIRNMFEGALHAMWEEGLQGFKASTVLLGGGTVLNARGVSQQVEEAAKTPSIQEEFSEREPDPTRDPNSGQPLTDDEAAIQQQQAADVQAQIDPDDFVDIDADASFINLDPATDPDVNGLMRRIFEMNLSERDSKFMEALTDAVNNTNLKDLSPDKMAEFVTKVIQETAPGLRNVRIDASVIESVIEDNPEAETALQQAADNVGGMTFNEQLEKAKAVNGDVLIPVGEYAARIAPSDVGKELAGETKLRAGAMTPNELADQQKDVQTRADEIQEAAKPVSEKDKQVQTLYETSKKQLKQLQPHMTKDQVKDQAAIDTAIIVSLANRAGMTVNEFLQFDQRTIQGVNFANRTVTQPPDTLEQGPPSESQQRAVTETDEFKAWFGDSKVVDENGDPLVVYHGTTTGGFTEFDPYIAGEGSGNVSNGFYFTESRLNAETYANSKKDVDFQNNVGNIDEFGNEIELDPEPGIVSAFISIKNPLIVDFEGRNWDGTNENGDYIGPSIPEIENEITQSNYLDGAIINNVNDEGRFGQGYNWGERTFIVLSPEQIKSPFNRGTFDPTDPNILRQDAVSPDALSTIDFSDSPVGRENQKLARSVIPDDALLQSVFHGTGASELEGGRFSTEKIGTGEGAQAFGWGLYFASRKEVAEFYKKNLASRRPIEIFYKGQPVDAILEIKDLTPEKKAVLRIGRMRQQIGDNLSRAHVELELSNDVSFLEKESKFSFKMENDLRRELDLAKSALEASRNINLDDVTVKTQGSLFRAELLPDNDDYLDWDKPLSEQSEKVREKINTLREDFMIAHETIFPDPSGADIYLELVKHFQGLGRDTVSIQQAASLELNDLGIPGIKYLEGASRRAGEGHHNFVIFDEAHIGDIEKLFQAAQAQGPSEPPRGFYTPSVNMIALTNKADASTFMHEVAHWYIDALNRVSQLDTADASVAEDLQTIFDWLGVENYDQLDIRQAKKGTKEYDKRVAMHEQFADGFLEYLREGRAPNKDKKLVRAFRNFKNWLTVLYRSGALDTLDEIELSDEVREMFDRMVDDEALILDAQQNAGLVPAYTDPSQLDVTEAEWSDQQAHIRGIAEKARELRDQETARRIAQRKTRDFQRKLDKEKDSIRAIVEDSQVYRARQFLTRGFLNENQPAEENHKLDHEQTIAILKRTEEGKKLIKKLPKGKRPMTTKDGTGNNPDEVARMFGYNSGEAMLLEVLPFTQKQMNKDINAEALKRLESQGITEPPPAQKAQEAVVNEEAETMITFEIEAAERRTGTRRPPVNVLKTLAQEYIKQLPVSDVRPGQYVRQMAKHSRAAVAAAQKGDHEGVAENRYKQITNMYMYREAVKQERRIARMVQNMRRYSKPTIRKRVGGVHIEQIDTLLDSFDLRAGTPKTDADVADVVRFLGSEKEEGKAARYDEEFLIRNSNVSYKSLTVEQLEELHDTIENLRALGIAEQEIRINNERRTYNEIVDVTRATLEKNLPAKDLSDARLDSLPGKVEHLFMSYHARLRRMSNMLRTADGGNAAGPMYEIYMQLAQEAAESEAQMQEISHEHMKQLFENYDHKKMNQMVQVPGTDISIRFETIFSMGLNWGNPENQARVMETADRSHIHPDFRSGHVENALSTLTEQDWDTIQRTWDFVDSFWPEIEKLERATTGRKPKKVKPVEVVTKYGTYKGGYYPIVYDQRKGAKTAQRAIEREAGRIAWNTGNMAYAQTRQGHIEQRVGSGEQSLLMSIGPVLAGHVNDVIHDLTHRQIMQMYSRLMRQDMAGNLFNSHFGPELFQEYKQWVTRRANDGRDVPNDIMQKSVAYLRRGFVMGTMGWKMSTMLVQPLGLTQSIRAIGAKWVADGLREYLFNLGPATAFGQGPGMELINRIHEQSPFMRRRSENINREVTEATKRLQKDERLAKWESAMFLGIRKFQSWVDYPTWLGAYNKYVAQGLAEDKAIALADRAVRDSQGSGSKIDLSNFESSDNEFSKLFSTFYSFFNTTYNLSADAIADVRFRDDVGYSHLVSDYFIMIAVPALLSELLLARGPDDDEEWYTWAVKEQLYYTAGTMPLVRDAAGAIKFDGRSGTGTIGGIGNTAVRLVKQAGQGEADLALTKATIEALNLASPIHFPANQINRVIQGSVDLMEGKTNNPLAPFIFIDTR